MLATASISVCFPMSVANGMCDNTADKLRLSADRLICVRAYCVYGAALYCCIPGWSRLRTCCTACEKCQGPRENPIGPQLTFDDNACQDHSSPAGGSYTDLRVPKQAIWDYVQGFDPARQTQLSPAPSSTIPSLYSTCSIPSEPKFLPTKQQIISLSGVTIQEIPVLLGMPSKTP